MNSTYFLLLEYVFCCENYVWKINCFSKFAILKFETNHHPLFKSFSISHKVKYGPSHGQDPFTLVLPAHPIFATRPPSHHAAYSSKCFSPPSHEPDVLAQGIFSSALATIFTQKLQRVRLFIVRCILLKIIIIIIIYYNIPFSE